MEFWFYCNNYTEKLQLPVNPSEYSLKTGNKNTVVDIQALGEANLIGLPRASDLELSGFFPKFWAPYCAYRDIPDPWDIVKLIEKWKGYKIPVRLIITSTPINLPFAIEEFEYGQKGGSLDVNYRLALKEYHYIEINKTSSGGSTMKIQSVSRPVTKPIPKTYTVKSGDNLWLITKKTGGSDWHDLYNANQSTIGPDPNFIYPGQELVIPWATS